MAREWTKELKNPITIFFIVSTIVGFIFTFYFYYVPQQKKELSYQFSEPSIIYDSKNISSKIHVTDNLGNPINGNLYLVTGYIWNSGNLPIETEMVRAPIEIIVPPEEAKIKDFQIINQSDTINEFSLLAIDSNTIQLRWKYFDPNEGVSFQLFYLANDQVPLQLIGKVLGIEQFNSYSNIPSPEKKITQYGNFLNSSGYIVALIASYYLMGSYRKKYYKEIDRKPPRYDVLILISMLVFVLFTQMYFTFLVSSGVPSSLLSK